MGWLRGWWEWDAWRMVGGVVERMVEWGGVVGWEWMVVGWLSGWWSGVVERMVGWLSGWWGGVVERMVGWLSGWWGGVVEWMVGWGG